MCAGVWERNGDESRILLPGAKVERGDGSVFNSFLLVRVMAFQMGLGFYVTDGEESETQRGK